MSPEPWPTACPRSDLSDEDSGQLLSKLIHHLISHPASSVATRKLCSTLAQYSCKPISQWSQCVRSLALSFARQQPVLDGAAEDQPSSWDIFPQLSDQQLLILLDFAMNLAEEASKVFQNSEYVYSASCLPLTDVQTVASRMSACSPMWRT